MSIYIRVWSTPRCGTRSYVIGYRCAPLTLYRYVTNGVYIHLDIILAWVFSSILILDLLVDLLDMNW